MVPAPAPARPRPGKRPAAGVLRGPSLASVALLLGLLAGAQAWAGAPGVPSASPAKPPAAAAVVQPPRASSKPEWAQLTVGQQKALGPLRGIWPTLNEGHKRKWIALARNFDDVPQPEQAKLHSRMSEWVALSPNQRAQARLNFGDTQQMSAQDKRAAWDAYQALPEEEKRKLAAGAPARTPPTAVALRPVPAEKLAPVPRTGSDIRAARIEPPATPPAH